MLHLNLNLPLWFWIPMAITVALFLWAVLADSDGGLYGVDVILRCGAASVISMVAWIVGAILK